ncbi:MULTISPECIES: ABC transporter substrate-binding protein [Rhodomicrobium]|uniref:ABC transporter substrate-binding protein n=1 Tax=Rhodomicrobium TaxID=1068 RepID=UPI000B4A68DA|nr:MULTISPECIES: ABC transporter substrate-binding protein [Rhodomicrobium]
MTLHAKTIALTAAFAAFAATAAPAKDLTIGLSAEASSIDPHFHQLTPNNQIRQNIFESLVAQDEQQKLKPSLATKWEAVDDTNWRFTLREGVKFSNGADFTARDMIYSVCRVPLVKDSPSPFTSYTRIIAAMTAESDHSLLIKTVSPDPLFPVEMSQIAILSAAVNGVTGPVTFKPEGCDNIGTPPQSADFNKPEVAVGTGPYKLVSYTRGDRIVLEPNPGYWGEKPVWTKVTLRPITSDAPRVAALLAGDVDMIENPPVQDIERIRKAGLTVAQGLSNRLIYLHMDQEGDAPNVIAPGGKNPLLDARVRAAMSKAINRKGIVERIMGGMAQAAGELLPAPMFGTLGREPEAYDPDGAKKLMVEAGYPDGFEITLGTPNDRYVNDEKIAQAVAQMLARINIKVKVDTSTASQFFTRRNKQEYPFYLSGWSASTGDTSSPLVTLVATFDKATGRGGTNAGRYSNPKMDALLSQALSTIDDDKRADLLRQAQTVVLDDHGILPLHFEVTAWAFKKDIDYKPRTDQYTLAFAVKEAGGAAK